MLKIDGAFGARYIVVFRSNVVQRLTATGVEDVNQTTCLIHRAEEGWPVAGIGCAYHNPADRPDAWEGRYYAFTAATAMLPNDRIYLERAFDDAESAAQTRHDERAVEIMNLHDRQVECIENAREIHAALTLLSTEAH